MPARSPRLFIDYGYEGPAVGDTLQAVRAQSYEDPLAAPGAVDLTAHVDFAAFAADAARWVSPSTAPARRPHSSAASGSSSGHRA